MEDFLSSVIEPHQLHHQIWKSLDSGHWWTRLGCDGLFDLKVPQRNNGSDKDASIPQTRAVAFIVAAHDSAGWADLTAEQLCFLTQKHPLQENPVEDDAYMARTRRLRLTGSLCTQLQQRWSV